MDGEASCDCKAVTKYLDLQLWIMFLDVFHAFDIHEVFIMSPKRGIMGARRRKDDTIRHGQLAFN